MGIIYTEIELRNALDSRLQPYVTKALVDTVEVNPQIPNSWPW